MLQSSVLQNSMLNCKSTKPENVTFYQRKRVKGQARLLEIFFFWLRKLFEHILNTKYKMQPVLHAKFASFQQNIALFNGTNTYETTLFVLFGFI